MTEAQIKEVVAVTCAAVVGYDPAEGSIHDVQEWSRNILETYQEILPKLSFRPEPQDVGGDVAG